MKTKVSIAVAACGLIGVLLARSPAAADPPSVSTAWKPISLDQAQCLQRAETILRDLTDKLDKGRESIFAEFGDNTAQVLCVGSKGVVLFTVAGVKIEEAISIRDALYQRF
jgi:hypothetical protein